MVSSSYDVIIIGAGAAGMFCAIEAAKRGRKVLVLDHARKPGEKIRISGGGRCNFTNRHASAENFVSNNPHFMKSALARYTAQDFIDLVDAHTIAWHEKKLGQLFCDGKSTQIIDLLLEEMNRHGATLKLSTEVKNVRHSDGQYILECADGELSCQSLVVACGGKSIPKMGASDFGYRLAEQFGLGLVETRPALVPFIFDEASRERFSGLSGVAFDCTIANEKTSFKEAVLITHRGLSGPAVLQISSFWREGEIINVHFDNAEAVLAGLQSARTASGSRKLTNYLAEHFPKSLAVFLAGEAGISGNLADLSKSDIQSLNDVLTKWQLKPSGSEGYRTAEVTLGGVDTNFLDAKTMESKSTPGLYFIGEVVDVTGWLGGYNFQWAWSSGWVCGQAV